MSDTNNEPSTFVITRYRHVQETHVSEIQAHTVQEVRAIINSQEIDNLDWKEEPNKSSIDSEEYEVKILVDLGLKITL